MSVRGSWLLASSFIVFEFDTYATLDDLHPTRYLQRQTAPASVAHIAAMASNDPEEWPNSDFANVMLDVKALKLAIKQSTSTYRRGVRPPRPALSMEDARGRLAESLTMLNNSPLRPVQPLTTYLPLHSIPYVRKLYSQIRKMRTAGVEDGDKELLQIYLQDFVRAIKPDHPLLRRTEDAPEEEEVVDAHACAVNEGEKASCLCESILTCSHRCAKATTGGQQAHPRSISRH